MQVTAVWEFVVQLLRENSGKQWRTGEPGVHGVSYSPLGHKKSDTTQILF